MIQDLLCSAFCRELMVTEVPIGYAVSTGVIGADGDRLSFYIRRDPLRDDHYRLEDAGYTIADLEAAGFDLDKESRFEALSDILRQHGSRYDEEDVLLATGYFPIDQLGQKAISFSYMMSRLQDLLMLVTHRVERSFKEDLAELIERQFGKVATIERNAPIDKDHRDYVVDFVIRSPKGQVLAVFAGSSELKALESLLFWEHIKSANFEHLRSMIVLEASRPAAIKQRTLSRVMNSGLVLATLDGGMLNVGEKMERELLRA